MDRKQLSILTIFLGSMLLFGVQPMVGRTLLPFFGGTAAVWVVCLCAFQVLLLGGYFYAHRLSSAPSGRTLKIHLGFLILSALWAFLAGHFRGDLGGLVAGLPPAFGVLLFLALIVGVPYLALSANSSLVQALSADGDKGVYRLYAVSNVGSLVGLFLYPFVLEPFVSVSGQWRLFGLGIALYAILLFKLTQGTTLSAQSTKHQAQITPLPAQSTRHKAQSTKHKAQGTWLLLPAISCAILNAVTTHLTLDVIALPLLWCVLLALFLLSYVIGFSGFGGRCARVWDALTVASLGLLALAAMGEGGKNFAPHMVGGCGIVLFGCTAIHVRLYELRPETGLLTRYYLFGAIGGAVGGVLTSLVAPMVFNEILEYPIALVALVVVLAAIRVGRGWKAQAAFAVLAVAALTGIFIREHLKELRKPEKTIYQDRGFFGTLRVRSNKAMIGRFEGELHQFTHGSTLHGMQFLAPGFGLKPTLYFTPHGGGLAIQCHPKYKSGESMRVGLVGMGMGVSCAYGRSNDVYRCWEISPEVMKLAKDRSLFSFVSDSAANVETVLGDARMALERERAEDAPKYDVLQIDAFSGDAVPYHLSTKEAFKLYFDRLAPGGFLSVHISNWHIDLAPMIKAVADEFDAPAFIYRPSKPDNMRGECMSMWGFIVRDPPKRFTPPKGISRLDMRYVKPWSLPTDEKGSLIGLLRVWEQ